MKIVVGHENIVDRGGRKLEIAIVSPYPPPMKRHTYSSGVTPYTKNLVRALKGITPSSARIFIISEKLEGTPTVYSEDGVYVIRCFSRSIAYVFQVFKQLSRIRPTIVHIQHEYFLYGGLLPSILFPLLVLLSRLSAEKVIVTLHHGVFPLGKLDDKDFRRENGLRGPAFLLKLGLLSLTRIISLLANNIIVHEPFMKKYLIIDYRITPHKIRIIPHGVENLQPLPTELAKEAIGLKGKTIILYFGYLTGYKGIGLLIEAYKSIVDQIPDTALVIAGGPHPRLAYSKWYREWIKNLLSKIASANKQIKGKGRIVLTGYVAEDKIPVLFSAADLIVLPYRARISASGPEALAIAYEKPYYIPKDPEESSRLSAKELSTQIYKLLNSKDEHKARHQKHLKKWTKTARLHLLTYLEDLNT